MSITKVEKARGHVERAIRAVISLHNEIADLHAATGIPIAVLDQKIAHLAAYWEHPEDVKLTDENILDMLAR